MRSKFLIGILSATVLTTMTTSCTQMARHSNTLMFGTNTTFGVGVGQGADQTPKIDIGYNRQEVAIVPVLANTTANGGKLNPCPEADVASCKFEASHNGKDKDSYSTLASFGGTAGTDSAAGGGKVEVAQYFATGVAAQQLVISGGANVIQAGGDTKAKADAATAAAKAAEAAAKARISTENTQLVALKAYLTDAAGALDTGKRDALIAGAKTHDPATFSSSVEAALKSPATPADFIALIEDPLDDTISPLFQEIP